MDSKIPSLIQYLGTNEEYRKLYVGYKVMVEHRPIPQNILKDLPFGISRKLQRLYYETKENYETRKRKVLQKR